MKWAEKTKWAEKMTDKKVKSLIAKLTAGGEYAGWREREDARRTLAAIGAPAVPALIRAVKSKNENWDIAHVATKILGEIGSSAIPALIETYADESEDWGLRDNMSVALVQIGPPAVPALLKVLEDGNLDWSVRCMIARTLEEIGDPQAVPVLIKHLADFSEGQAAIETLKRIGSRTLPALMEGLKDDHADYVKQYGIVHALVQIGPPAIPALVKMFSDSEEKIAARRKAAETLGKIAQHHPDLTLRAALPILRRLRKRDPIFQHVLDQIESATAASKSLPLPASAPPLDVQTLPRPADAADMLPGTADVPPGDPVTPPPGFWTRLGRKIEDKTILVRQRNLEVADKTDKKVKSLIAKLTAGGEHEGSEAAEALELKRRINAAGELGRIGDPRAVPVLVQACKKKKMHSLLVQTYASIALGDIRNPQAVPALIKALNDKDIDGFTYRCAIKALIAIGDPQAASALIRGLKDDDTEVRIKAAIALGRWKSREAVPALITALKDSSSAVTRYMFENDGTQTPLLTQWVCNEAAGALGEIGDARAVPALSEAWQNKRYGIRTGGCAIRALGAIGGPLAVHSLIGVLGSAIYVKEAVKGLKMIEPTAAPAFLEALSREKTRALVIPALIEVVRSDEYVFPRRHAAELLKLIAEHQPDPALRAALPTLRWNYWRTRGSVFKEATKRIEAVTATPRNLPLPAAAPSPDTRTLPRPADAADMLPGTADMPPGVPVTPPRGFWEHLRRKPRPS